MGQESEAPVFEFSGGALCLDFVNTLGDRPRCDAEKLGGVADLLAWARQAGIVDTGATELLEGLAARDPRRARQALRQALDLRETLYRIFSALAAGTGPAAQDLRALNAALASALRFLRVAERDGAFGWEWSEAQARFDRLLWPVARSAAELLTSADARLVRECGSDTCSWLFLDRSRTHRRRWCDMKTCGNRAKARRHYERQRLRPPGQ